MSFLGDIWDAVSGVAGTIFGIGKTVVSGANDLLQASGIASLVTSITSITNSIDGVVKGIGDALGGIVKPITDVVDSVSNLGRDIQDKIIGPIVTPIADTIKEIDGLSSNISRLVDQGIGGIAKIPGAIADALGGIQASWDKSTRQLADAQGKIASETLVPGITAAVAPGLKDIALGVARYSTPQAIALDRLPMLQLASTVDLKSITELLAKYTEKFKDPHTIWDQVGAIALDLVSFAPLIIGYFEAQAEEAREAGKAANPVATFEPGIVQTLFQRGLINAKTAQYELQKSGFDETRQIALLDLTKWLPSLDQAGDMLRRGIITQATFEKIAGAYGAESEDVVAMLAAMKTLIGPQILLDWLARGIVDQVFFDDQMKAQGYDGAAIAAIIKGGVAPPQVNSLIAARGNLFAADNRWFESTYGAQIPDDVANAARASRIDLTQAAAEWTAHWRAMPIATAVELFFRGQMNRDEVRLVVTQNDYPPDMVDLFIEAQSLQIQPRTVPQMLARGTIDENKAREILKQKGYSDLDVDLLIADANALVAAKRKSASSAATKLSVSEITTAYADGVIDEAVFRELLGQHGFAGHDLDYMIAVENYTLTKARKRDQVATLKAEVALGTKTVQAALDELTTAGFNGAEIERIQISFHQQRKSAAKLPSYADMVKGFKHGLLDDTKFLAGIQALGYSAPWDQFMFDLASVSTGSPSGSQAPGATA